MISNYYEPVKTFSPTKEQAKEVFWKLGDNYWKQIIDGKYHHLGSLVFDKALHNSFKEPGFLESLEKGCHFASEHLGEKVSVEFYKDLHKKLCSHFKGEENDTLITAEKCGKFRTHHIPCPTMTKGIEKDFPEYDKHVRNCQNKYGLDSIKKDYPEEFKVILGKRDPEFYTKICKKEENSRKIKDDMRLEWMSKINHISNDLEEMCNRFEVTKITKIYDSNNVFCIYYDYHDSLEKDISTLFEKYNKNIEHINQKCNQAASNMSEAVDEKIDAIADLFQMLDWFHPFPDGQGRTDLVLMSKLLCEQGANPAILDNPYFSTERTSEEWKKYLREGMKLWNEAAKGD